ncbi:ABC transporter ATP-binding protein [Microbacterium betulae]|uniref:ABC transporter ATP-binding protein n=1 Tax=Microbacterium betulae TaxID=2981139 RepID=A0AA97I591_9MICO|nr:ABC transporter ATP-binding protein [Microbacterium sp. AB]WOF22559.1 ABC transporter ATP-binding protein [Microbacterium sp. AB]
MTDADIVIDIQGLKAGYVRGVDIVHGVDLAVSREEIVCILGPNGAGKSTLLKAVYGLARTTGGTVSVAGRDVTGHRADDLCANGIGFVPQSDDVYADLSVEENLRMGAFRARKTLAERRAQMYEWFPILGEKRKQPAGSLSGGQRRLVGIARALMTAPSVLLLDEPSAGLSPTNVDEVFERIEIVRETGVTVLMVEQNAVEALEHSDRGYILDLGRLALEGRSTELLVDPRVKNLYLGLEEHD